MSRSNTSLARWGSSLAIRIPKAMLEVAQLKAGDELEIELQGRTFVIQPVSNKPTLQELVDGITPDNCHAATDWGPDVGNEAW